MSTATGDRDPLDLLAEEFVARLRAGEPVTIAKYAERHPDLADAIRALFPTLLEMERLKPRLAEATEDHSPAESTTVPPQATLGEFRILREIGRGGMGVVYEAVQESLGRHVALKVLPADALTDPKRRERFRREARAAAKLHHTNIVPVFGTGEAAGLHYYAMQFIPGQGLDRVLAELRNPRAAHPATTSAETVALTPEQDGTPASVTSVPTASRSLSGSKPAGRPYWQSMARLGVQAASGLAHAHAHGVLHRDIKPSNLLLDPQGTLWIADFGLAKLTDEADLTAAGDILGTLRYMAPERFQGQCDERADIYAVGLTLYELATLRPAFDANGREKLIAQVTQGQPVRPSKLNPAIPRDLETIVLKAIARDPAARYQTATELADDLQRFVEDRPIRARRASAAQRLWRWSRRNPVLAGLTATTAVLLVAVAVSATIAMLAYRTLWGQAQAQIVRSDRTNGLSEDGYRYTKRHDWAAAVAAYTQATELSPDNSQVWSDRATVFLRLGLADEAATDFARLFEARRLDNRPPNEPAWWYYHATLRLHAGDAPGYRAVCRAMRQHFPDAASTEVVRALVLACTLAPEGCDDPRELVRLVDEASEREPTGNFAGLRVAALYRAGEYREVVAATTPAGPNDHSLPAASLCFRAMSLAALGEVAPARANMTGAREKFDAVASVLSLQAFGPRLADRYVGMFPPAKEKDGLADWLFDDLLWRETTARIDPAEPEHPLPLFLRARGCAALEWWDQADAATTRAIALCLGDEKAPRIPEVALVERAHLNAVRGRWSEVAADLDRAGPLARPLYPLATQASHLNAAFGRHEEARRLLAGAVARAPRDLDLRFQRGQSSIQLGDWDTAAEDLSAILGDPRWIPPRMFRPGSIGGGALSSFFPEWREAPARAAAAGPDPRKEVREEVARRDELYARVIARQPGEVALKRARGRYLLTAKRFAEAVAFYSDAIEKDTQPRTLGPANSRFGLLEIGTDVAPWPEVFEPLVKRWPGKAVLWAERSGWLRQNGDIEKAAALLARGLAVEDLPGQPISGRDSLQNAAFRSEELFRAVVARRPRDADLWLARIYNRVQDKDRDGAEKAATAAASLRPNNLPMYRSLIGALGTAYPELALKYIRDLARLHPDNQEAQMQLFVVSVRGKNWDEAANAFGEAVRLAKRGQVAQQLQNVYFQLPSDAEALGQLARRLPENGQLWMRYARSLGNTNPTAALEAFEKATADPTLRSDASVELLGLHLRLKQWDKAAAVLDRLDRQAAQPGQAAMTAVSILYSVQLDSEAVRELSQRRPRDGTLWQIYGRQLAAKRRWPEAAAAFEKAGELLKNNAGLWTDLAWLHVEQHNWKEAARAFDKALTAGPPVPFPPPHQPGNPLARPTTLYNMIVSRSFTTSEGRALFTAVAELRPKDGRLWIEYCRYLSANKSGPRLVLDAELARGLEELVKRAPKEPIAWLERATFRVRMSEFDKAVEDYAEAAGLMPPENGLNPQTFPVHYALYNGILANANIFDRYTAHRKDDPYPWFYRSFRRPDAAGAFADLERAIQMQPKNERFQTARGTLELEYGEWDKAATGYLADLKRAEPAVGASMWYEMAAALAAAGRTEAYRAFCQRMETVWKKMPRTPVERQQLAWAGGLLPDSGMRPETLLELAEPAWKAYPDVIWNVFTVALARCRLGQHEQAVALVRDHLKRFAFTGLSADHALLEFVAALALARDGKMKEARTYYDAGCKRMQWAQQPGKQRQRMTPGHTWAAATALRREVEELLKEKPR